MASVETFLITGIPGAGKSTTSRRLAAAFARGVHVEGDVLSSDFVVKGVPDPFGDAGAAERLSVGHRRGGVASTRSYRARGGSRATAGYAWADNLRSAPTRSHDGDGGQRHEVGDATLDDHDVVPRHGLDHAA